MLHRPQLCPASLGWRAEPQSIFISIPGLLAAATVIRPVLWAIEGPLKQRRNIQFENHGGEPRLCAMCKHVVALSTGRYCLSRATS